MRLFLCTLCTTFFLSLVMTSCNGDDPVDDIPVCIAEKLETFRNEACPTTAATIGGNLVTFDFRSELVYCFNWGSCRPGKTIEIYRADCSLMCEMGGAAGGEVCDGVPWASVAMEVDNIFQN